jgi:hypothetical protein
VSLALLPLAGCGGSSNTSSRSSAPIAPPATTATTATTSPSTTPAVAATTPAPTTSTAAAANPPTPHCVAAQLALSYLGGQGATGHGELGFALRNTSSKTCVAFGYPGVLFLDRAGSPLPTNPIHTTTDFFGTASNHPLALGPGDQASFRLGVTHGAASTAGCTTAYGLQVIPPNDTATLRATIPSGAYECRTTTVTPLQAGTSAFA